MKHKDNSISFRKGSILFMIFAVFNILSFPLVSCSDDPLEENYYTFTGEMVSDYLTNRPDMYSEFTEILQRSGMFGMMATYGTYTCLAPTNDAVNQYLRQRGYTNVSQLTQEECDTISWNHIIPAPYFTTDLRQMTGRYYRVTVNKCGWLIEDYLNL